LSDGHISSEVRRSLVAAAGLLGAAALFGSTSAATLPVQHLVVRTKGYLGLYSIVTMKPVVSVQTRESWVDGHSADREVTRKDGVVVEDSVCAVPQCSFGGGSGGTSFRTIVQRDIRSGKARFIGAGKLHGRAVRWYRYGTLRRGQVFALDKTYAIVREVDRDAGRVLRTYDTLVSERVPRRAIDFTPATPFPQLIDQQRSPGTEITAAQAASTVPGAVWPGSSVVGVPVGPITSKPWSATTAAGARLSGTILDIRYGPKLGWLDDDPPPPMPDGPAVEVIEAASGDPVRWFTISPPVGDEVPYPPPAGLTDVFDTSFGLFATLQKPGVWLVVRANSLSLLRTTLNSLQPIG
jgi:hypothetical protein